MAIVALHFGDPLEKDRIRRIPRVECVQQRQRTTGIVLVPEIEKVQLVVGLPCQERAPVARLLFGSPDGKPLAMFRRKEST